MLPSAALKQRRLLLTAGLTMLLAPKVWAYGNKWLTPPVLDDATLIDQDNVPWNFNQDLLKDRCVVINFFYTGCTNVCPPQTALMRELHKQLTASNQEVLILSLSVDPLRDRPNQLKAYAERFNLSLSLQQGWLMLTGDSKTILPLLNSLGANTLSPEQHPSMVWVVNDSKKRSIRTSGFNSPVAIMKLVKEIQA